MFSIPLFPLVYRYLNFIFYSLFIYFEREREREREREKGRGRERETERIPSRLRTASTEPNVQGSNSQTLRS